MLEEQYQKNNKALCDVLTLYLHCKINKYNDFKFTTYMLVDEVIKDLEDKDVNISLKDNSLSNLFIKDNQEYKKLKNKETRDYRYEEIYRYCYENVIKYDLDPFNLIQTLFDFDMDIILNIFGSNISLDKKTLMLYDLLISIINSPHLGTYLFNYLFSNDLIGNEKEMLNDLVTSFRNLLNDNYDLKEKLFLTILNAKDRNEYEWLNLFQKYHLVDFSNIYEVIDEKKYSIYGIVYSRINCQDFLKLYQNNDLNIPNDIRKNDSYYLLNNLPIEELASFISLKNCLLTIENLKILGNRVFNYQMTKEESDEKLIEEIKEAIVRKATNKEEYKIYKGNVAFFSKLADYKGYMEQQKEIQKKREQEKTNLLNARNNLVLTLQNLNENAIKEVPIIKNLKMKK